MKKRIMIIDDNCYKIFTTKQVLEAQLRMKVRSVRATSHKELMLKVGEYKPDVIIFRPSGGVMDLLRLMQRRNTNRRNSEIAVMMAQDFDDQATRMMEVLLNSMTTGHTDFAAAA